MPSRSVLDREAARLVLPRDAVKIQQVREHLLALMRENLVPQRDLVRRHNPIPRQLEPHLKLKLRLGGLRQVTALARVRAAATAVSTNSAICSDGQRFGVQHQVE